MTALTLTPDAATASVLVEVTGAPTLTTAYTQGTGVDGWAASAGSIAAGGAFYTRSGAEGFKLTQPSAGADALAVRTISGLSVGTRYRFTAWHKTQPSAGAQGVKIGVTGIGQGSYAASAAGWRQVEYQFVAAATSHELTARVTGTATDTVGFDDLAVVAISSAYGGTTLTRVDANGVHPVRLLPGQEPIAGVMTVRDYEPALVGTVRYDLVDAAGATTSASAALTGVSLPQLHMPTLPSVRAALASIIDYSGARESTSTIQRVIRAASPVVITGPLALRTGTVRAWCADYATARAVEALADTGQVLMLRQPDYPGMDMWLTPDGASIEAEAPVLGGYRWAVALGYREVDCPPDPLQGAAGWTFAQLSTAYTSFAAVRAAFTDFADLTAGP